MGLCLSIIKCSQVLSLHRQIHFSLSSLSSSVSSLFQQTSTTWKFSGFLISRIYLLYNELAMAVDQPQTQCSGLGGEGPHDRRAEALLLWLNRQTGTVWAGRRQPHYCRSVLSVGTVDLEERGLTAQPAEGQALAQQAWGFQARPLEQVLCCLQEEWLWIDGLCGRG